MIAGDLRRLRVACFFMGLAYEPDGRTRATESDTREKMVEKTIRADASPVSLLSCDESTWMVAEMGMARKIIMV